MIRVSSSDGICFTVDRGAASLSGMISNLLKDAGDRDEIIPIGVVQGAALNKVLHWCTHYHGLGMTFENSANIVPNRNDVLSDWDREFMTTDLLTILEIGAAANYMYILPLLHVAMKALSTYFDDKGESYLRDLLGITNPFSPEMEELIKAENAWIGST